jgi:hypothetical protein
MLIQILFSMSCRAALTSAAPDGWAMGRYLASALVAWIDELKSVAKS